VGRRGRGKVNAKTMIGKEEGRRRERERGSRSEMVKM